MKKAVLCDVKPLTILAAYGRLDNTVTSMVRVDLQRATFEYP